MLPQSSVQQEVQAHRPTTRLTRQMQRLSQRSDLFRKLNPYQLHIPTNMDAKDWKRARHFSLTGIISWPKENAVQAEF